MLEESNSDFQLKWDLGKGSDFYLDSTDFTVFTFGGVPLSVWVDGIGWTEYPDEFNYQISKKLTEDQAKEYVSSGHSVPKSSEQVDSDPDRLMWDD